MSRQFCVLATVIIVALLHLTSTAFATTKMCRCEKLGSLTNCSSLELTEFQMHSVGCAQSFTAVDLSKNKIHELPEDVGEYRRVNLSSNALIRLEAAKVQKVEVLDLSKNLIHQIDLGDTFPSLLSLNVSENGLGDPNTDFLTGECNLVHLDLSGNTIVSLDSVTRCSKLIFLVAPRNAISQLPSELVAMTKLEYLDLNMNRLKVISNLPKTLKVLHLNKNAIATLRATSFKDLDSLMTIDLEANRISSIAEKTFEPLVSLQQLNLNENKLTNLSAVSFQGLKSLMKLGVSNNDIASLADDTFSDLHELKELILDENVLTTLPALRLGKKVYRVSFLLNLIQNIDVEALTTIFSGSEAPRILVLILNNFRGDDPGWKEVVKEFKWKCSDEFIPLVQKFLEPNVLQSRYQSLELPSHDCPCALFSKEIWTFGACINDVPTVNGVNWLDAAASPNHDEL